MSEQSQAPSDPIGDRLLDSLRALIEDPSKPRAEQRTAESRRARLVRTATLVIAGIDVSAVMWLMDGVLRHPFVVVLLKAVPAIFGLTLAANIDAFGRAIRAMANRRSFQLGVTAAALPLLLSLFASYDLPLVVPLGAHVFLDSVATVLQPVPGDSVRLLPIPNLGEHRIEIAQYDTLENVVRRDEFAVGWPQLLRARARALTFGRPPLGHYRLAASILSPVTIDHPPQAMVLEVRDTFPELYLRRIRREQFVSPADSLGRTRIQFLLHGGSGFTKLSLPAGRYEVRYYTSAQCWSAWDTVVVRYAARTVRDMRKLPCARDPLEP